MSRNWYVRASGEELGPLSDDELRQLAAGRQITPFSQVRKGWTGDWVLARRVRGLFCQGAASSVLPTSGVEGPNEIGGEIGASMNGNWFVQVMGQAVGPLSDDQLRALAGSSRITPTDLVRKGHTGNWVPSASVRGLFAQVQADITPVSQIPQGSEPAVQQGQSAVDAAERRKIPAVEEGPLRGPLILLAIVAGTAAALYVAISILGADSDAKSAESTAVSIYGVSGAALVLAFIIAMANIAISSITSRADPRGTEAQALVSCGVACATVIGLAAIPIAVLLSQYWPLFGGPVITEIAEPWSPARKSGIATHCIVLGLLAALLAGVGGAAARFLRTTDSARPE